MKPSARQASCRDGASDGLEYVTRWVGQDRDILNVPNAPNVAFSAALERTLERAYQEFVATRPSVCYDARGLSGVLIPQRLYRIRIDMDRLRARLGGPESPAPERVAELFLDHLGFRREQDGRWVGRLHVIALFREGEVIDREPVVGE